MEIISTLENGKLAFGDYTLTEKAKKEDFPHCGNLYKIKTFNTMTKLEKNGLFLFESVPGTTVTDFEENEAGMSFKVECDKDAQITVELEENTEYDIEVDGKSIGKMKANSSGKINLSVELQSGEVKEVKIVK
ncbi:MAG: endosialidase [Lachnospiraceae bacterium]|nr:endosialidase [Lachnospiraceae bacterium]